ncbi:hypothetical protein CHS0354_016085 [Potamilus streckersoni]|uniref:Uncharacterized protein n=1 Tax=Potamilus streckersoni TaxID=2493646 RepID=A0AAE0W666_9BIVA|nr:hypothetical protein CHS0354_016085 [Potamilus streckersoni]
MTVLTSLQRILLATKLDGNLMICELAKRILNERSNCRPRYFQVITRWWQSDSSRTKQEFLQKHINPTDAEVLLLKQRFANARQLVDTLYRPIAEADEVKVPLLQHFSQMNGQLWKARLQFLWPIKMRVTAVHEDQATATENVYLLACCLLQDMGFIQVGENTNEPVPMVPNKLIEILESLQSIQASVHILPQRLETSSSIKITNSLKNTNDKNKWVATMDVSWPEPFSVSATAKSLDLAYYQLYLLSCMKFKTLGYLSRENTLMPGVLMRLNRDVPKRLTSAKNQREEFNPDYEMYVDASRVGFGAYLLTKEDRIHWLSDPWSLHKRDDTSTSDSNLDEFYALVTACFTWKHKFIDKKVLCFSDNQFTVNLVNSGLYVTMQKTTKLAKYEKLYQLLEDMCSTYNIKMQAIHVHRIDNVAADHLSRCQVSQFKKYIPMATDKAKKTKKLHFLQPFVQNDKLKSDSNDDDDNGEKKS